VETAGPTPEGEELWIAALGLMKCSKGGLTWPVILEMDVEDFNAALDAAEELEKRIAKAMKG